MTPGMVDENAAHGLRGHTEEVGSVLPRNPTLIHEPQVGLVDQCRSLERVIGALSSQVAAGEAPQLRVDEGHQPV